MLSLVGLYYSKRKAMITASDVSLITWTGVLNKLESLREFLFNKIKVGGSMPDPTQPN